MSVAADRRGDSGMITIQYVVASACALVFFVLAANLLVDLYVRAAVRDALDEGVRAAVPLAGDASVCLDRANDALHGLVHGSLTAGINVRCARRDGRVIADADVVLPPFLALLPAWSFRLHAEALQEGP